MNQIEKLDKLADLYEYLDGTTGELDKILNYEEDLSQAPRTLVKNFKYSIKKLKELLNECDSIIHTL